MLVTAVGLAVLCLTLLTTSIMCKITILLVGLSTSLGVASVKDASGISEGC